MQLPRIKLDSSDENKNLGAKSIGYGAGAAGLGTLGALAFQHYNKRALKNVRGKVENLTEEDILKRVGKEERNLYNVLKGEQVKASKGVEVAKKKGKGFWGRIRNFFTNNGAQRSAEKTAEDVNKGLSGFFKTQREKLIEKGENKYKKLAGKGVRNKIIGGSIALGAGLGVGHYIKNRRKE